MRSVSQLLKFHTVCLQLVEEKWKFFPSIYINPTENINQNKRNRMKKVQYHQKHNVDFMAHKYYALWEFNWTSTFSTWYVIPNFIWYPTKTNNFQFEMKIWNGFSWNIEKIGVNHNNNKMNKNVSNVTAFSKIPWVFKLHLNKWYHWDIHKIVWFLTLSMIWI